MKYPFFEGWYLKHQAKDTTIAFIPACHTDSAGHTTASVQIITNGFSCMIPIDKYTPSQRGTSFNIHMDQNHFSLTGISVHLRTEHFYVKGCLQYGPVTPLQSDIMGPFSHIPCMQCNHKILSLYHPLTGSLDINGSITDFTDGTGYIEKDWGRSFPQSYLWTQCNFYDAYHKSHCCIMLSIAHIPFFIKSFTGCICTVYYAGREYRLATYHHVKILEFTEQEVILEQGDYLLHVNLLKKNPLPLMAPNHGSMTRTIHESPACLVRYQFYIRRKKIFDIVSPFASFETCGL